MSSNTNCWGSVQALGIPLNRLPVIKRTGERIGHTHDGQAFGLPAGKQVYVPMGDHPCSVLATKQLADSDGTSSNPTCTSACLCDGVNRYQILLCDIKQW